MDIDFLLRRIEVDDMSLRFRLYVPPDYDQSRKWPAVVFMHGAGERGSDAVAPTNVGIGCALRRRKKPYPAIIVFPQCPRESHWALVGARAIAVSALVAAENEFNIDSAHVSLTGISMGAAGAWTLASEWPDRFASLAPICGWVSHLHRKELAKRIAHVPTWIFHGDSDNHVPVDESRVMYAELEAAGAHVRYTELRGVGHNSWDPAYEETDLMEWMIGA